MLIKKRASKFTLYYIRKNFQSTLIHYLKCCFPYVVPGIQMITMHYIFKKFFFINNYYDGAFSGYFHWGSLHSALQFPRPPPQNLRVAFKHPQRLWKNIFPVSCYNISVLLSICKILRHTYTDIYICLHIYMQTHILTCFPRK